MSIDVEISRGPLSYGIRVNEWGPSSKWQRCMERLHQPLRLPSSLRRNHPLHQERHSLQSNFRKLHQLARKSLA